MNWAGSTPTKWNGVQSRAPLAIVVLTLIQILLPPVQNKERSAIIFDKLYILLTFSWADVSDTPVNLLVFTNAVSEFVQGERVVMSISGKIPSPGNFLRRRVRMLVVWDWVVRVNRGLELLAFLSDVRASSRREILGLRRISYLSTHPNGISCARMFRYFSDRFLLWILVMVKRRKFH